MIHLKLNIVQISDQLHVAINNFRLYYSLEIWPKERLLNKLHQVRQVNRLSLVHPVYTRASDSHRCVGTLEAPTSYGNNRLCLRAVGARKLVEILIKGAILSAADCGSKYELHLWCSRPFYVRWKWKKTRCAALLNRTRYAWRIYRLHCNCWVPNTHFYLSHIPIYLVINGLSWFQSNSDFFHSI